MTPDRDNYHSDFEHVTSSMLRVFRRSPRAYHARYVEQSIPQDTTPRLELGSAIHARVLEPDRFHELVAVAPACDRRTTLGREKFNAFQEEAQAGGKIVIDAKQAAIVEGVAKSVEAVPLLRVLLKAEGVIEFPTFWVDGPTGLKCKCRPDKWLTGQSTVLDLKSSSDGSAYAFEKALVSYGYAQQAEHYKAGTGAERFVWLVVDIEPPFECYAYELDAPAIAVALKEYRQTIHGLARAYETQDWELAPKAIRKISLPAWAMPKEERAPR